MCLELTDMRGPDNFFVFTENELTTWTGSLATVVSGAPTQRKGQKRTRQSDSILRNLSLVASKVFNLHVSSVLELSEISSKRNSRAALTIVNIVKLLVFFEVEGGNAVKQIQASFVDLRT